VSGKNSGSMGRRYERADCPRCGRAVSVWSDIGGPTGRRLRTHNAGPGVRCPGSKAPQPVEPFTAEQVEFLRSIGRHDLAERGR